jgi:hypothetical protein
VISGSCTSRLHHTLIVVAPLAGLACRELELVSNVRVIVAVAQGRPFREVEQPKRASAVGVCRGCGEWLTVFDWIRKSLERVRPGQRIDGVRRRSWLSAQSSTRSARRGRAHAGEDQVGDDDAVIAAGERVFAHRTHAQLA